jgi:hypothetical protein
MCARAVRVSSCPETDREADMPATNPAHHSARFEAEPELREKFIEAGRAGGRKRWGPSPVIRMHSLAPELRAAIGVLVEALADKEAR